MKQPKQISAEYDNPPYSAASIANLFLNLGFKEKKPISPMQIQKLIYLAHGYYLYRHNGEPLINEVFQAWRFGPVLSSIYFDCRHFGRTGIKQFLLDDFDSVDDRDNPYPIDPRPRPAPLPDNKEVKKIVDFVWRTYGKYDPIRLSQWTHEKEGPWDKITKGGSDILRNKEVPNEEIHDYFKRKLGNK